MTLIWAFKIFLSHLGSLSDFLEKFDSDTGPLDNDLFAFS